MDPADCVLKLSWEGFASLCRLLALRVADEFSPGLVVGIARGGTLPGALIALLMRRDFQSLRAPGPSAAEVPPHLPPRRLVGGRRVLVVDERVGDGSALRWAVDALRRLGAAEVRSLILFGDRGAGMADYAGPEIDVPVLQPWIAETLPPRPTAITALPDARDLPVTTTRDH